jgi:ATP-binding cassette subfamily B protein
MSGRKARHIYRGLLQEARPFRRHLVGLFTLSVASSACTLLLPVPLKIAVDSVIGSHPLPAPLGALPRFVTGSATGRLLFAALLFVVIILIKQIAEFGRLVLSTYAGQQLLLRFRARLFHHLQQLSLARHDSRGVTDSTYRIQYDTQSIQTLVVTGAIPVISALLTVGGMLYVTARIDWRLGLIALGVTPPLLVTLHVYRKRLRSGWHEAKRLESSALSVVQEALAALRVVKAFGQEKREENRFVARSGESVRAQIGLSFAEGNLGVLVGLITALGTAAVLIVGTRRVQSGALTVGDLVLVMAYLQQLFDPLQTISKKAGSLQSALASAERVFSTLDEEPAPVEARDASPLARARGEIAFDDVTFAYDPGRAVLKGISFSLVPGNRVGVVGVTGAGKTTLVSLLARFYDPISGRILLDGTDLRAYRVADLRNQLAIVLQEPVLFSTSIAENIAYARPDAGFAEIRQSAKAANAHDFISDLPDGYETQVGERGMRLSGGERQRISLARAFLKDAPILILDEPTSSVDLKTEALILDAMERLMAGRTSFMIAHRLSTLEICDLLLEVDNGRIVRRARRQKPRALHAAQAPAPARTRTRTREHLSVHPAVKAWLSLEGAMPRHVRDLKPGRRFRKTASYLLESAGPDSSDVVAKLCARKTAETETVIYGKLLPRLPMPSLRFYGSARNGDSDYRWLFLEDAGGDRYSPIDPEHRRLAARWLAMLRFYAAEMEAADLPDRGSRHYLVHLLSAREEITRQLRREQGGADGAAVLEDLLDKLNALESSWGELAAFCDALPRTLVHGDFVPKNLRICRNGAGMGLTIFDWEMAGIGVQAPDLAQLLEPERSAAARGQRSKRIDRFSANPCLETYRSMLAGAADEPGPETIELSAAVGNVLRCIAGIDWTCSQATTTWTPVQDLRVYSGWLGNAMKVAGWTSPSRGLLARR